LGVEEKANPRAVEVLVWRKSKREKQIPHPAKTAGIRDDICIRWNIGNKEDGDSWKAHLWFGGAWRETWRLKKRTTQDPGSKSEPGAPAAHASGEGSNVV
jgi:hypothetical protein